MRKKKSNNHSFRVVNYEIKITEIDLSLRNIIHVHKK